MFPGLLVLSLLGWPVARPSPLADTVHFAKIIEQLSEPGGKFDSENLVSNERSYLHVVPALRRLSDKNQAYIGVGPDQNFSYIAAVRPNIAFIVDIRRENLLLHLLYKSIFEQSRNRIEFLCLLYGRAMPANSTDWEKESLPKIIEYLDSAAVDSVGYAKNHANLIERINRYGLSLSASDIATLRRFHGEFFKNGLNLRFSSTYDRGAQSFNPTIRDLYRETDLDDKPSSFLADESDFRFVQRLQLKGRIIPVVGDFSGTKSLKALGEFLEKRRLTVSLFYVSNVEIYLFQKGGFRRFVDNVLGLPWSPNGLIARSYFAGPIAQAHPKARAGYPSVQLLQKASAFLKLGQREDVSYWDILTEDLVSLEDKQ